MALCVYWHHFLPTYQSYHILTFIIYTNIHLRKLADSIWCLHEKQTEQLLSVYQVLDKSSSELNLIFIYFSSQLSVLLVIDLIRFLIFFHSSSYYFCGFQLSSVGTSVTYFFPSLSSVCPFVLLRIRSKGFTPLIATGF